MFFTGSSVRRRTVSLLQLMSPGLDYAIYSVLVRVLGIFRRITGDIQMCRCTLTGVQVYRCTSVQVYKYTGVVVDMYGLL